MALPYVNVSPMEEAQIACVCKDCAKKNDSAADCNCPADCEHCVSGACLA